MSYNPINLILTTNKLIEPNYGLENESRYHTHFREAKVDNSTTSPPK